MALSALFLVLKELQFDNFLLGIKNLIVACGIAFDLDEVTECMSYINSYMGGQNFEQTEAVSIENHFMNVDADENTTEESLTQQIQN